ncbi:hypothetical protein LV84_03260 [Algoriphagus ratkowskyi]|uniref:Lipoprotein n=1 Tax=Algoriphagus ratkowskyi TaxID=57028 RepID=A0A2W7R1D7_9BACT|nr:DUF6786 family protein [Algoriphagus ratkowskyi]PZX53056.1 hypothetical protein LV84_03260 [Algoriphagus ratkowskyi]
MVRSSVRKSLLILGAVVFLAGCRQKKTTDQELASSDSKGYSSYDDEVSFLKEFVELTELTDPSGKSKIAVSAALQGRVMTSTALGENGRSYGWINRELFSSGDTSEHFNAYGGEERFWLGPEGGQFSVFFKNGDDFNLDNWYTPRLIDLEKFEIKEQGASSVVFTKEATLTNYSGFQFELEIERKVEVLSPAQVFMQLGIESISGINTVAYQTTNTLKNMGSKDWEKETGLLSIWLLGMFNPSPSTTIVIPFHPGSEADLGIPVNDNYFGKVPHERLILKDSVLYFSADGTLRSKIGLSPARAKNILGSYDATNRILTILQYNQPQGVQDYVNSMWEIQASPFTGDVINSYNDGPAEPGKKPMGPFYELETSSPALALKSGQEGSHIQLTCHFEGDEEDLDRILKQILGVSIDEISKAFN